MPTPTIDLGITERFFETMLGPDWASETLILQAFDDDKDRIRRERRIAKMKGRPYRSPRAHTAVGVWAQVKDRAISWAKDGCCVSWAIQRFEGKRRDHPDYFRGIRCVALDFDTPDQPLPEFPLTPHAVVETSPGKYHVYWRVDLSREAYDRLMPVLIDRYGADPNAADVCRVLRLPGFPHQKKDSQKALEKLPTLVTVRTTTNGHVDEPLSLSVIHAEAWPIPTEEPVQATRAGNHLNGQPGSSPARRKSYPAILPSAGPFDFPAITKALACIPSEGRQTWLTVGMALASISHPRARLLWDDWSQQSDKYDPDDQSRTWDSFKEHTARVSEESARVGLGTLFHLARQHGYVPDAAASWKRDLITTRSGEPTENVTNVCLWLTHDETWQGRFWWDAVANVPMCDDAVVGDQLVTDIAHWLGQQARIPIRSLRLVERCITAVCQQTARDPIVEWLDALPPWDGIERLESWLEDVAEAPGSAYGRAVSRLIPVSMVARAKAPGCLYRYVVILEGPEESGKSSLVRALGQRWYANMSMMLESKESHMAIQGVWVAELTELDSLTRSEENRIKSFLTMTQDDYVPKYSNTRVKYPRRTVFVGTTNEQEYLKGLSGNTRFLPIPTRAIDVDLFEAMREQLFAEALVYVATHPQQWWDVPTAVKIEASLERDVRRHTNEYEERIAEWLLPLVAQGKQRVSWPEIAEQVLKITSPEAWKDTRLLAQVRAAMRALGWVRKPVRDGLITRRLWIKADSS